MTEKKKRHWFLTTWLVLLLLANSWVMWSYTERGAAPSPAFPDLPGWAIPSLMVLGLFILVCTVGLFKLKKWGFYGSCVSCGLVLIVNLSIGLPLAFVVGGPLGIILLYGVLQIGGDKSGWTQLD